MSIRTKSIKPKEVQVGDKVVYKNKPHQVFPCIKIEREKNIHYLYLGDNAHIILMYFYPGDTVVIEEEIQEEKTEQGD